MTQSGISVREPGARFGRAVLAVFGLGAAIASVVGQLHALSRLVLAAMAIGSLGIAFGRRYRLDLSESGVRVPNSVPLRRERRYELSEVQEFVVLPRYGGQLAVLLQSGDLIRTSIATTTWHQLTSRRYVEASARALNRRLSELREAPAG